MNFEKYFLTVTNQQLKIILVVKSIEILLRCLLNVCLLYPVIKMRNYSQQVHQSNYCTIKSKY